MAKKKTIKKAAKKKPSKAAASKRPKPPTFLERLGALTHAQACRMLGEQGAQRLRAAEGLGDQIVPERDVTLTDRRFELRFVAAQGQQAVAVSIWRENARAKTLSMECSDCAEPESYQAAALAYLLEAKSQLGLAQPPDESVPLEHLTDHELRQRALADRAKRAAEEPMRVKAMTPKKLWSDYLVSSRNSGQTYRVALRGFAPGESYCSCPDFARNQLGTCKHIMRVQIWASKKFKTAERKKPYRRQHLSLRVHYGKDFGLRFNLPHDAPEPLRRLVDGADRASIADASGCMRRLEQLERAGHPVHVYPDAESLIQRNLMQARLREQCADIRKHPAKHPLRSGLLNAQLLPYQLDGIAFAVGAGRAILADDMGLGKTIQGIGVAELLFQLADIRRVLVVCPASLKGQWRSEVQRFSGRSVQLVDGPLKERVAQYQSDAFFTVCNYEQVLRDVTAIEAAPWDLIVLDEGQRIKNWESKTSNVIRRLSSPFRLVLSGTPLENRLGELYTVMRFIDEQRLGPADRFFHRHREVDERGKTIGFKNLELLRRQLAPVLLRRTRGQVAKQLPARTDEIVRVEPTQEQKDVHDGQMKIAAQVAAKKWMTQMDLLRLRRALGAARMVCDSTWLIDQQEPEYSSKLERFEELMQDLLLDPTRKVIVFSEWRRMLDRIQGRLNKLDARFVRLDGTVPQKKRPAIVSAFQQDPACRVILMTNAGSTGLNLQSATTVVNVDLPWNPAVLEQRIGRAHRMGQKNPVHVYKLVTSDTIEERLLDTLADKQGLADAALDLDSDVDAITLKSGMSDLRQKLEKVLMPALPAPVDVSQQRLAEKQAEAIAARRAEVSAAGGQLVSAALGLAGKLLDPPGGGGPAPDPATVDRLTQRLGECVQTDERGRPQLTLTLADADALRGLATTLAKLLG